MGTKRCYRTTMFVLLCVVLAGGWNPTWARVIYVDDDAGAQDGTSRYVLRYLQDALSVAQAGDEIRVAQGVYRPDQDSGNLPPGDRHATFRLPDGVTIKGGFAGVGAPDPNLRDTTRFATILTGDLAGNDDPNDESTWFDNTQRLITAMSVDAGTVLDGLTIAHGYADDEYEAAALYNEGGSLVVRDCTFRDNRTHNGVGGVYNHKGHLRLEHCRFLRNWSDDFTAALHTDRGSVEVIASEFVENASGDAATVDNDQGQAVFFGCLFRANRCAEGMGVVVLDEAETSLLYCTFIDNSGFDAEGGVTCVGGRTRIAHCLFAGNRGDNAGALTVWDDSVSLDQCTFYGNVAWEHEEGCAGALCVPDSFRPNAGTVTARGCIFWGNRLYNATGYDAQIRGDDPNRIRLEYCCIEGWTPQRGGIGNIGVDPLFVAPDQNDFHLKSQAGHWDAAALAWVADDVTSPCIDAGDPNSLVEQEPFPNGGVVNLGVYGGTSEASKSWFGAEPCPAVNAADLNGDCRVDAEDFRLLSLRWLEPAKPQ